MRDFFISYTKSDLSWAEWIAHTLETAGYTTYFQKWDFPVGSNFVLEMHRALNETSKTIFVLSKSFHESLFTQPEWAATFVDDPMSYARRLLPVRVDRCRPAGLLRAVSYLDLVGLNETQARIALLDAVAPIARRPTQISPFLSTLHTGPFPSGSDSENTVEAINKTAELAAGFQLLDSSTKKLGASEGLASVAIIDVDGMSGINKRFGVDIGNMVLRNIPQLLLTLFPNHSTGRCGDDTFFLFLQEDEAQAKIRMQHFVQFVTNYDWSANVSRGLSVTVSAAAAQFRDSEDDPESPTITVLRAALGCRQAQLVGKAHVGESPTFLLPEIPAFLLGSSKASDMVSLVHSR